MVYSAYFTELNLKICDYAQKWRICRENCKYALDENFHDHFCPRRKAAKFCHPVSELISPYFLPRVEETQCSGPTLGTCWTASPSMMLEKTCSLYRWSISFNLQKKTHLWVNCCSKWGSTCFFQSSTTQIVNCPIIRGDTRVLFQSSSDQVFINHIWFMNDNRFRRSIRCYIHP